jgi:hypothetical protein
MTYIATEPELVETYKDQRGQFHQTRDDALEANFADDFRMACFDILENHDPKKRFQAMPVVVMADFVRAVIERNPEMVLS